MALQFPNINPIALKLGPLQIHWYAIAYLAGFIAGWRYMLHLAGLDKDGQPGPRPITKLEVDDFLPWAIGGVILGGRLGYILFYQAATYLHDPLEIFRLWHGGMSFHGGALGVVIAMIWYAARRKLPVLRLTDMVCCAVPIGLFFGRIANFVNGELYGRITDVPWGIVFPGAGDLPRHPSQLYEAGAEGLMLFTILCILAHIWPVRNRLGTLSGVFLVGYALCRMTVELVRQPDAQLGYLYGSLTMGQVLSVPMILLGLSLILRAMRIGPPSRPAVVDHADAA